jgi:DNA-binding MarR family transcriptional regulator
MKKPRSPGVTMARDGRQPLVGALLRMAYQVTRERQLKLLRRRGFSDLNQALLNVMIYPHPDRVRPSELAERTNMTKQAMNYLLGHLESLGYIERRAERGSRRRLVFLTNRGWQVVETNLNAMRDLQTEWAAIMGKKKFDEFMAALRQLASIHSTANVALRSQARGKTSKQFK